MGPNRAKWQGKTGPNEAKRGKTGQNGAKQGQMEPNGAKWSQTGPNRAKRGLTGANGSQQEKNGAKQSKMEPIQIDIDIISYEQFYKERIPEHCSEFATCACFKMHLL